MTDRSDKSERLINGRYEIQRRLARGGMADVYLARDQVLQRLVAVKVLFDRHASDPKFVTRFRREAQSAAKLNHPNIVAVYDTGVDADSYYIAMEYVEGRTVADLIRVGGPMSVGDANKIASEVADGLAFAHGQGIVHRDIKPSNIMVNADGVAKVADFGIARAFAGGEDLTDTGQVIGTASYFSPEQAQGFPVDPRSDLYSLGVVLFEMVTGRPPFRGTSPVNIAYKHVEEPPPLVSTIQTGLPAEVDMIVSHLLAKDPTDRYRAAVELKADLDRLWNNEPLHGPGGQSAPVDDDMAPTAAIDPIAAGSGEKDGSEVDRTAMMPAPVGSQHDPIAYSNDEGYDPPRSRGGVFVAAAVVVLVGLILAIVAVGQGVFDTAADQTAALIEVPTLIGDSQATATNRLSDLGLVPDARFEPNSEAEPGTVIAQDPPAQTEVAEGSPVQLVVSGTDDSAVAPAPPAVQPGAVPSVFNELRIDAERLLRDQDFEVRVEEVDVDPNADTVGRVISQSPEPGQAADPGTVVVIQVGRAAEATTTSSTVSVPSASTTTTSPTTTASTTTTTRPTTTASSTTTTATQPTTSATEAGADG